MEWHSHVISEPRSYYGNPYEVCRIRTRKISPASKRLCVSYYMLYIASDHAGFRLNKRLVRFLEKEMQVSVKDMGPEEFVDGDDYPDYAVPLAQKVVETGGKGILICGNGVGVCIVANKIKGIRAGIGYNTYAAESMRQDDDTNILCLAGRVLSDEYAMAITKKWLQTEFSNEERHIRRLEKEEEILRNCECK